MLQKAVIAFDRKTLLVAFIVMCGMTLPLTYAHELFHAWSCYSQGALPSLQIDFAAGTGITNCEVPDGQAFNPFEFSLSGGLGAALLALLPAGTYKAMIGRHSKALLISCGSLSVAEAFNGLLEGFATQWYLSHAQSAVLALTLPTLIIFLVLVLVFSRKRISVDSKIIAQHNRKIMKRLQTAGYLTMLIAGLPITGKGKQARRWARRQDNLRKVRTYLLGQLAVGRSNPTSQEAHTSDGYVERLNALCWGSSGFENVRRRVYTS